MVCRIQRNKLQIVQSVLLLLFSVAMVAPATAADSGSIRPIVTCQGLKLGTIVKEEKTIDGGIIFYSLEAKDTNLAPGQTRITPAKALELGAQAGPDEVVVATEMCGGFRNCLNKRCPSGDLCKQGKRGCVCREKKI